MTLDLLIGPRKFTHCPEQGRAIKNNSPLIRCTLQSRGLTSAKIQNIKHEKSLFEILEIRENPRIFTCFEEADIFIPQYTIIVSICAYNAIKKSTDDF